MSDGGGSPHSDVLASWAHTRGENRGLSLPTARDVQIGAHALAFVVQARTLNNMADLAAALRCALAHHDLVAAASGLVSGVKASSATPFHFADWPEDWVAHYMANSFLMIDPAPRWARNSGAPLTWSELFDRLSPRDPGHRVFEASKRFGLCEGMVVPMRSSDNRLGLVSFGGGRGAIDPTEQAVLAIIARAAFEAAERIETKGNLGRPAAILSAREIECLAILVRGHSDQQLANLLGLSTPTVRFHLANARDKLGATSRTHLAALAVAQGYICL